MLRFKDTTHLHLAAIRAKISATKVENTQVLIGLINWLLKWKLIWHKASAHPLDAMLKATK